MGAWSLRLGRGGVVRVLIAVPTFDTVLPDTFKSLWDLDRAGHEVGLEVVRGYGCAMARNRIAEMTLECGWDACLMVDSDMVLPHDALSMLMPISILFFFGS